LNVAMILPYRMSTIPSARALVR